MIRRTLTAIARYLQTPPDRVPADVCQSIELEIDSHLAHSVRDHMARGRNEHEALQAARREFGSVAGAVHACRNVWHADQYACHRAHLVLTAVLLAVLVGWLVAGRGGSSNGGSKNPQQPSSTSVALTVDAIAASWTGDLRGRVVDERSLPIDRAHILAVVKTWPQNGYRQQAYMTTTGPDGAFGIDDVYPIDQLYEVQLAVLADGRLLESTYVNEGNGPLASFEFQLQPATPFSVRFRGSGGRPMEGVEAFPHRRTDRVGHDHLVYFQSADPIIARSDSRGEVRLPYYGRGDAATIYFRPPGLDWATRVVVVPNRGRLVELRLDADEPSRTDSERDPEQDKET